MTAQIEKVRIQKALIQEGKAGTYYKLSYDSNREPVSIDKDAGPSTVAPQYVGANEVSSSFHQDPRFKRDYKLQRESWSWALFLRFPCEVVVYDVEEAWLADPPVLARDPGSGLTRQVTLLLVRSDYSHPTIQEPKRSEVTFFFEALLSRA